jgi:hypothetical protein
MLTASGKSKKDFFGGQSQVSNQPRVLTTMTTVEATPAVNSLYQAAERAGALPTRVMGVTGPLRLFNKKRLTSGTVYEGPTATVPSRNGGGDSSRLYLIRGFIPGQNFRTLLNRN